MNPSGNICLPTMHIKMVPGAQSAFGTQAEEEDFYKLFGDAVTVCKPLAGWTKISQNKKDFWRGRCTSCSNICTVPFQPFSGYFPPVCRGCLLVRKISKPKP